MPKGRIRVRLKAYDNSREDFMIKTHKRIVDIMEPTDKTIDQLMHLDLPAGVDVEIKM